jgi:glycosyltransferase involved in cell wall biosynthesis
VNSAAHQTDLVCGELSHGINGPDSVGDNGLVSPSGPPLRIGVNALYLIPGGVGGTEIYLRCLLKALAEIDSRHEYFIYTNAETGSDLIPMPPRFHIVQTGVRGRIRPGRILYEQTVLPSLLRRDAIDVLLNPGFTGPVSFAHRSVSVFHDLQHKRHPEFFRWFDLPFWNALLWVSATRSRSLIAVSRATASDLARYYPRSANRISVIPHGVDTEFFRIAERRVDANPGEPFLLSVSTLHPHKNIDTLMQAFAEFRQLRPEFRLVIAGLNGFAAAELERRRLELGLEASVRFTGWISREELYRLFEGADAFIAPSRFEGFGMPLSEALAAGIPTACSTIEPFNEIAGDAAIRFSPDSLVEMTEAMRTITSDPGFRRRARVVGPAQARRFDWRGTARLTLDVIEA